MTAILDVGTKIMKKLGCQQNRPCDNYSMLEVLYQDLRHEYDIVQKSCLSETTSMTNFLKEITGVKASP